MIPIVPSRRFSYRTLANPASCIIRSTPRCAGKRFEGLGDVEVGLGVAVKEPADGRHHGPQKSLVEGAGEGAVGLAEVQHDRAASGREHAAHLRDGRVEVRDVAQAVADRDDVECSRRAKGSRSASASTNPLLRPPSRRRRRATASIGSVKSAPITGPAPNSLGQKAEVAAAAAEVENPRARADARRRQPHRLPLPAPVHPEAHDVVDEVVPPREPARTSPAPSARVSRRRRGIC